MDKLENRLDYYDGFRGIAAMFVVLCHLSMVFFQQFFYIEQASTTLQKIWIKSPLNIINNGDFSVQYFFVLSGFMITRKIYLTCKRGQYKMSSPFATYKKLLMITVPSILFSFFLMKMGGMKHIELSKLSGIFPAAYEYNNFKPNFFEALFESVILVFFKSSKYVGPLWSIKIEFIGSILISAFAFYDNTINETGKKKYYYLIGSAVFLPLHYYISSFFLGAFVFDVIYNMEVEHTVIDRVIRKAMSNKYVNVVVWIVGLYLACINTSCTGMWSVFTVLQNVNPVVRAVGIAICIMQLYRSKKIQKLLSGRVIMKLGKLSPYIYAIHWPIILSLGAYVYIAIYLKTDYANVIAAVVSIGVTIMLSILYYNCVSVLKLKWNEKRK